MECPDRHQNGEHLFPKLSDGSFQQYGILGTASTEDMCNEFRSVSGKPIFSCFSNGSRKRNNAALLAGVYCWRWKVVRWCASWNNLLHQNFQFSIVLSCDGNYDLIWNCSVLLAAEILGQKWGRPHWRNEALYLHFKKLGELLCSEKRWKSLVFKCHFASEMKSRC